MGRTLSVVCSAGVTQEGEGGEFSDSELNQSNKLVRRVRKPEGKLSKHSPLISYSGSMPRVIQRYSDIRRSSATEALMQLSMTSPLGEDAWNASDFLSWYMVSTFW